MEVNVRDDRKIVEVWFSNTEKANVELQNQLKPLYSAYKARKYTVAVFCSGTEDLFENTSALLVTNRKRLAELEVQREKTVILSEKQHGQAMGT